MAILLAAMLLLATPYSAFAASSWETAPSVSLQASNIQGADRDTLELSVVVKNSNFKALGAALEYDTNVLQLIDWTSTGAAVNLSGATGWNSASIVESKSPDNMAGKPALAYANGAANKGYLYMGAESAVAQDITDATQVVTVRFGYVGSATFSAVQADTIKFASGEAAYKSPVKGSMIYQTEDRATGNSKFFYLNPLKENGSGGYEEDTNISGSGEIGGDGTTTPGGIVPEENGETVNTGKADASDFVSLTFYDWDDTLLGTRIVTKGDSLKDPNGADKAEYEALKTQIGGTVTDADLEANGFAPLVPYGNELTGANNFSGTPVTATNKIGYEYAGWVDYNTGMSTPQGAANLSEVLKIDPDTIVSLDQLQTSRVLKPAYNESEALGKGTLAQHRYAINYTKFKNGGVGVQSTFTVSRTEKTRRGTDGNVTLIVDLRPKGLGQTRLLIPLGKTDVESYTITMPANGYSVYTPANGISLSVQDAEGNSRSGTQNIKAEYINHNYN